MSAGPVFVEVFVEEHELLPDGCGLRFRAASEVREAHALRYETEDGEAGVWSVEGEDAAGARSPAHAVLVHDSGGGTSLLVYGGAHGLRLTSASSGRTVAEPYLLLGADALVGGGEARGG